MSSRPGNQDQPDRGRGDSFPQLNPNPIIGVDSSGHVTFLNDGATRALECIGKDASPDVFLPKDMDEILAALKRHERATFRREATVGDRVFEESIHVTPEHDAVGIYATDITEHQQAEEALRVSEERFRRAFEDSGAGKLLTGLDGRLLRVNRAFAAMLGYTVVELQSLKFAAITHPDDVALSLKVLSRLQSGTEGSARFEKRYLHKNGSVVWADLSTVLLRDATGRPGHFVADVQNITARKQAEAALSESEERYRRLVAEMGEGIGVGDADERFSFVNRAAEELFGVPRGGLVGRNLLEFLDAEQTETVRRETARRRTGKTDSYDLEITRPDGTKRTALVTSTPRFDAHGNFAGSFGIFRDITEWRHAERQVQAERDQWRRVLDAIPEGAYVVGQDYELQYVNPSLLARAGPVNGRKCYRYFHGRTEPCPDCANPQVFAGGTTRREYTTRHGGVTFDIQDVPVAGHEGRPARLVFMRDVTERKRAGERDRQHLEDTALLRDTALGFITLDPGADIYRYIAKRLARLAGEAYIVVNSYDATRGEFSVRAVEGIGENAEAVLKLLGRPPVGMTFKLTPEELHDYSSSTLMKIEGGLPALSFGKLPKVVVAAVESVFGLGEIYAMSFYWQEKVLGTVNIIMHRDVPLRNPAMVEAFVNQAAIALQRKIDADELDRHRAHLEELVRDRTAELEVANQELEAFSYSVSHDLRAPLRAIDGFTQTLLEDCGPQLDTDARGRLDRVSAAARRMAELIDELLNLARVTRLPLERKPVDLSETARAIATELRHSAPGRPVEFVIANGLTAPADPVLAAMVLRNLIGNAWKFTSRHATARIEVGETRCDGKRTWYVRDDGAGFDMAYVDQLFAPFQRLHPSSEFPGSGIGLAIVHRIVRRHGGRVWIEAEVNKGTTCRFTLEPASRKA
jgi:PAS domain S-box-containing protein